MTLTFPNLHSTSLAHRVATLLARQLDTELTPGEVAEKFGVNVSEVDMLLNGAVRQNILNRSHRRHLGNPQPVYLAGPLLREAVASQAKPTMAPAPAHAEAAPVAAPAATAPAPVAKGQRPLLVPATRRSKLPPLDFSNLPVEDGIPVLSNRNAGSRYDALFDRLQQPGQSVALPALYRKALADAMSRYRKAHPDRKFSVGACSKDAGRVRVIRTA